MEPPSWWRQTKFPKLRILLTGDNLTQAKLNIPTATNVRATATHLWFDIDPNTLPTGPQRWSLSTPDGTAPIPFEIQPAPLGPARRQGFGPTDTIYLVMPDRFFNGDPTNDDPPISKGLYNPQSPRAYHGGDLQGVIDKLPYLKDLGITILWLTPWYDNANRHNGAKYDGIDAYDYHGYAAIDFYAVDEHFGTLDTLRKLVTEARKYNIRIMQDQVANHAGPLHPWVTRPPLPNWFHPRTPTNWQIWTQLNPNFDPPAYRANIDGWFANILPDLNQDEPEVATYLIQNALWWVGVTGLELIRQDTAPYVPQSFWAQWNQALHREFPGLETLAEVLDPDPQLVSLFQGHQAGFDTVFDFPLYFALRQSQPPNKIRIKDSLYTDPSKLVTFLGLHDTSRYKASWAEREAQFKAIFETRGVPLIYYGDEIGLEGGEDPDNRRDMPWANLSPEAIRLRTQITAYIQQRKK